MQKELSVQIRKSWTYFDTKNLGKSHYTTHSIDSDQALVFDSPISALYAGLSIVPALNLRRVPAISAPGMPWAALAYSLTLS